MIAALSPDDRVFWAIALGMGAVVVVVVIALLTLLLRLVHDIDEGVASLWTTAKRLAQNTSTTHQLGALAATLTALKHDLDEQEKEFSRR
jgi:ABC-type Fe3+ transport system permease subunit